MQTGSQNMISIGRRYILANSISMSKLEDLARELGPEEPLGPEPEPGNSWTATAIRALEPIKRTMDKFVNSNEARSLAMMALPVVAGAMTHRPGTVRAVKDMERDLGKDLPMPAIFRSAENAAQPSPGIRVYPLEAFSDEATAKRFVPPDRTELNPSPAVVFGGGGNTMYAHGGVSHFLAARGLWDRDTRTIGVSAGSTHIALELAEVPVSERLSLLNETFDVQQHGDILEFLWQFHPLRSELGNGITDSLPRSGVWPFGVWNGKPIDTVPQWERLAKRLNLQNRITPNHSFIAYDPEQAIVVEFRGGPADYNAARAIAASTAYNLDGFGINPVETVIRGHKYNLVDFGLQHNHPTSPILPENQSAIVSSLFQRGANRPQDTIIKALRSNRLPFDRVDDAAVVELYRDGYEAAEKKLSPKVETPVLPAATRLWKAMVEPFTTPIAGFQ